MKKKETKEFRVLGRMLAEEIPKETLEKVRGAKISSSYPPPDVMDVTS